MIVNKSSRLHQKATDLAEQLQKFQQPEFMQRIFEFDPQVPDQETVGLDASISNVHKKLRFRVNQFITNLQIITGQDIAVRDKTNEWMHANWQKSSLILEDAKVSDSYPSPSIEQEKNNLKLLSSNFDLWVKRIKFLAIINKWALNMPIF